MEGNKDLMTQVSVIIPNYNGMAYLPKVLGCLRAQSFAAFETILVDNASTDGSLSFVEKGFPEVRILRLDDNYGFSRAVNEGIKVAASPYVLLLNNDTEPEATFVEELYRGIERHKRAFSCQAKMINQREKDKLDDAGNLYCALGWAFARGKGESPQAYEKEERVFSCCAGAAIYRKEIFQKIGFFDDEHFAYLEDLDVGYRARIYGYENWYCPRSVVYHVGSGTSGSRYNLFKIRYSSRNNVYMIYKNMPLFQLLLNLPFLILGFGVKTLFFTSKGYGREYLAGIKNGFQLAIKGRKVPFSWHHLGQYVQIQWELWGNILRRL